MTTTTTTFKRWTAAELRRLPAHEREVVLRAAAEQAEAEYRTNPELTAFEAVGEDDNDTFPQNNQSRNCV